MTDPVSIGTTIFKAAVTLKKVIEGVSEIYLDIRGEKSCYKLASELIEQIQEIENIRKGHVSNNMAGLDESLARLEECGFLFLFLHSQNIHQIYRLAVILKLLYADARNWSRRNPAYGSGLTKLPGAVKSRKTSGS